MQCVRISYDLVPESGRGQEVKAFSYSEFVYKGYYFIHSFPLCTLTIPFSFCMVSISLNEVMALIFRAHHSFWVRKH